MRLSIAYPDGTSEVREVSGRVVRLGRDARCEVAFNAAQFPKISSLHAQIERTPASLAITHKSQSNKTLVNDSPVEGTVPLKPGDRIRLGFTGPVITVQAMPALEPPKDFGQTVQPDSADLALLRGTAESEEFELGSGGVIGRDPKAHFVLDHPHVSRKHARLTTGSGRVVLTDLGSANGTFVNGNRTSRSQELKEGDRIEIGPFSLVFDGELLVSRSRSNNVELVACGLTHTVSDRATDEPLTVIDDISLVVRPREFVCIIGPSGSGKSTLLRLLSGRAVPKGGLVLVNGRDLHADFSALKQDLAVVPQTESLHDGLSVGAALRYTAELRLPPDTGSSEIERAVGDLLEVVGLSHRRETAIRDLSGGQLKRASLANELVTRPSLLYLDEVTSGLDEQTDREVMEVFRKVADAGKTVVCITHNLANVEATCHLVVILAEGGKLAFMGTPAEALEYFKINRLGDVYKVLSSRKPNEWKAAFRANSLFNRYVQDRLPPQDEIDRAEQEETGEDREPTYFFRQLSVLTRRYFAICRGNYSAMLAMLGQSLLVGILVAIVFGQLGSVEDPVQRVLKTINLLFILNVSCFWLGCNNAAKELVKEREIYLRERDFNLRPDAYLASKLIVLIGISLIQVTLLFGMVKICCGPPGSILSQWLALSTLAVTGTTLGLMISAFARSQEVAIALVPIAVIPQIILAGVIVSLSGIGKTLALVLITCYWGERALESLLPSADLQLLELPERLFWPQLVITVLYALAFATVALLNLLRKDNRT